MFGIYMGQVQGFLLVLTNSCIMISDQALFRSGTNGCLLNNTNTVTHQEISTSEGTRSHWGGKKKKPYVFKSLGHKKTKLEQHDSINFACKKTHNKLFLAGQYLKNQCLDLCY